ncbi:hypothetical protein BaRGS_00036045 [Batillaria attramentaria]|uniref:Uncharacterized protein n=1 Tax=Batillaria attramentaria TaxID=370345 RepID=A0ABD0JDS4_9CAEN
MGGTSDKWESVTVLLQPVRAVGCMIDRFDGGAVLGQSKTGSSLFPATNGLGEGRAVSCSIADSGENTGKTARVRGTANTGRPSSDIKYIAWL